MRSLILLVLLTSATTGCSFMSASAIQADLENDMANHRRDWVAQNRAQLSDPVAAAIVRGEVLVGMTPTQAMQAWNSWGPPQTVNRTVTASGESAQFVFSRGGLNLRHRYFYVEAGRVTAIQY